MKKLALVLSALFLLVASVGTARSEQSAAICGTRSSTTYSHVVVIVMENHSYSAIIGKSSAPYINSLAKACGSETNYFAIRHPSLPNYIAMTSGTTAGITDDAKPSAHPLTNASIFSQTGSTWRSYQESMPSNCALTSSGLYAVKHNPAAYFTNVRTACKAQDVPLPSSPSWSQSYTFVTPNLCNDMHNCGVQTGDSWLKSFVPKILASSQYTSGSLALFLTWDEGGGKTGTNQVPLVVVGPTVPAGVKVSTKSSHYGLLRTTQDILGKPCLAGSCSAVSLRSAFHL